MEFTRFENDLIRWYMDHAPDIELVNQLRSASLESRQYSGAGLFVNISISPGNWGSLPKSIKSPINGPEISSPALENGAASILFLQDGVVSMIEVYTYSDEMSADLIEYEIAAT